MFDPMSETEYMEYRSGSQPGYVQTQGYVRNRKGSASTQGFFKILKTSQGVRKYLLLCFGYISKNGWEKLFYCIAFWSSDLNCVYHFIALSDRSESIAFLSIGF